MKEKLRTFFQNQKLKGFAKKVFNKRTITAAAVVIVIAVALRITFSLVFEVEGVVNKVDGNKVTVANFIATRTVDISPFQTTSNGIQVGDRIKIMKNLSGQVISVRDESRGHMNGKGYLGDNGKHNFRGDGGNNFMRRR